MARKGKIDKLPEETRRLLADLRSAGATIDQIHAKLMELEVEISRGTVGRWVKDYDELGEELAEIRAAAEGIMKPIMERGVDDRTARLNVELMQALLFKLSNAARAGMVKITPMDMMFLSRATKDLQSSIKAISDASLVEMKVRQQLRTELLEEAKKKTGEVLQRKGVSEEAIRAIQAELGA